MSEILFIRDRHIVAAQDPCHGRNVSTNCCAGEESPALRGPYAIQRKAETV